jgi:hypothetical protein
MQEMKRMIIESYFSLIFLLIVQFITAIVGYANRRKFPELRYFHFYPLAALLQTVFSLASIALVDNYKHKVMQPSVSLFMAIEFLLIYLFAFQTVLVKRERKLLKFLFFSFIIYLLLMWSFGTFHQYYKVYFVQSVILLIPSIMYFFQIFRLPAFGSQISQPAFWVHIGILFFFSSTIPLFILETYSRNFIVHNQYLFSISYIAYGIFFLLICKAYLCKTATKFDYSLL